MAAALCRKLEEYMAKYGELVKSFGERPPTIRKVDTVEEVLQQADVRALLRCAGPACTC